MPQVRAVFHVSYSQYYMSELGVMDEIESETFTGSNGLVLPHEVAAIFMTGTETGAVSVTADWQEGEPPLDIDNWDDVVEVSIRFYEEPGALSCLNGVDGWEIPRLTPGSYRLRVHARGRDRGRQLLLVEGEPVEEHLIQAWPAPTGPEVRHKLTDQYGAMLREQ